jgi:hypothetical protein
MAEIAHAGRSLIYDGRTVAADGTQYDFTPNRLASSYTH